MEYLVAKVAYKHLSFEDLNVSTASSAAKHYFQPGMYGNLARPDLGSHCLVAVFRLLFILFCFYYFA
jgi:hypothetical protein